MQTKIITSSKQNLPRNNIKRTDKTKQVQNAKIYFIEGSPTWVILKAGPVPGRGPRAAGLLLAKPHQFMGAQHVAELICTCSVFQ